MINTVHYDGEHGSLEYTCGNREDLDGFYAAESDGEIVDQDSDAQSELLWDGETMVCAGCKVVFTWNGEAAYKVLLGGDVSGIQSVMVDKEK